MRRQELQRGVFIDWPQATVPHPLVPPKAGVRGRVVKSEGVKFSLGKKREKKVLF